jgi:drug/metabolite transporter (DMT)-like permease
MLAAAFFFSLMSLQVKLIGTALPASQVVFVRNAISLVLTFWMLRRAGVTDVLGERKGLLVTRGLLGFVALLCFFYAIPRLPLAEVTVIHFSNPIFVAVLAALLLGERLTRSVAVALVLCLGGVLLIARPGFLGLSAAVPLDRLAVMAAVCGALLAGFAYVTVRKLSATEHPLVIVLYFPLVSVPASIPFVSAFAWPSPSQWLLLLGVGLTTQAGQVFLTHGLKLEAAGKAMSTTYIQIAFATLWGWLFFSELPDLLSFGGIVLIGAGLYVVTRKRAA